jgi:MFS family permease
MVTQKAGKKSIVSDQPTNTPPQKLFTKIPSSVWMISIASMLLTFSSAIVTTIGPIYLIKVHNINPQELGDLESVVELVSQILRFLAGALSDSIFQRKSLMVLGFILSTATKILFPFATTYLAFFGVKVLDRVGNGVQASPRDALIGDCSPKQIRGQSFGLSQTLRKLGSTMGASVASVMLGGLAVGGFVFAPMGYELAFFCAIVPAIVSVIFLVFFVHPPRNHYLKGFSAIRNFFNEFIHNIRYMGKSFWVLMGVIWFYGIAHFNESFLQLRADELGASVQQSALVIAVLTFVTSFAAFPLGLVADRIGKKKMFAAGILFMVISNLIMMNFTSITSLMIATAFWGLHWAVTQGLLLSLIVDVSPKHLKGTAFGIYYILFGLASWVANKFIAGPLWLQYGAEVNFMFSAGISLFAVVLLSIASKMKLFPKVHD